MSQQQTVLRVQTNIPSDVIVTGSTSLDVVSSTTGVTYGGAGTYASPYTGTTALNSGQQSIDFLVEGDPPPGNLSFVLRGCVSVSFVRGG